MPTYQYACTECGEQLEAVQAFTDAPLTECPACGGRLRKVFSAVGVVFKGSGFYKTDSRASSGSGGSKGDAASSGSAKSDAASGSKDTGTGSSSSGSRSKDGGSTSSSSSSSSSSSTGTSSSTPVAKSA